MSVSEWFYIYMYLIFTIVLLIDIKKGGLFK